ncbi:MAG: protoglobin domain-containing protein [Isosphaeraceae bacterium]|nr:protoglobin domain-containing protein [Isosphaeraceae bacterium]
MANDERLRRYREFESYVGWTPADDERIAVARRILQGRLSSLIDDFYDAIERNLHARAVITGGPAQVARLKRSLLAWIEEMMAGPVDADYVDRRWRVGWRHADIGLDAPLVHLALSRLRRGLCSMIVDEATLPDEHRIEILCSLNTRLDLDLALIEDAYQTEHRARLQASERMATIGQVTGGVAHELRNPLNVVKTSVYYLLNAKSPTPEKTAEHLQRIERQVNLADTVIQALSNFARTPVPTAKPVSLPDLIRELMLDETPAKGITVEFSTIGDPPPAWIDRDQIRIVLSNLIRNALEAMGESGTLSLHVAEEPDSNRVSVAVGDTGGGISSENLTRIMEPLFSTKARGLGLGLAIARAIVDKHRGKLEVESELGRGSRFTLLLPAAPGTNTGSAAEPGVTK